MVLLSGEAGIGKSRLTEELRQRVGGDGATRLAYQCAPQYANSAFWPIIRQLQRAAGFAPDDRGAAQLDKLESLVGGDRDAAQLLAGVLSLPGEARYGTLELSPEARRQRTIQVLVDQLLALAARRPVLFLFEDAHWVDPSSEELLVETVARIAEAPVLMVVTTRPEWQAPWAGQPHAGTLSLSRLGRGQAAEIVAAIAGPQVGADAIERIVARTDGIPLFVEELTKALVERGLDAADADIPATLQASLAARLDRLDPAAREIAQIGAVIGREFDRDLLAAVADHAPAALDQALDRLLESQLVLRIGHGTPARYSFKHALVQDAAYGSLLRRRRQDMHLHIAQVLQRLAPDLETTQPELLAHHLQEGGDAAAAMANWVRAGDLAEQRSAAREAVAHYRSALAMLERTADNTDRERTELRLALKLGNVLMQAYGYASPEAGEVLGRAQEIVAERDDLRPEIFALAPVLYSRGNYNSLVDIIGAPGEPGPSREDRIGEIHRQAMLCVGYLVLGRFREAWSANERAIKLDAQVRCTPRNPVAGADPAIILRSYGSWVRFMQGYPDEAERLVAEAAEIIKGYEHAFSSLWVSLMSIRQSHWRGRHEDVVRDATDLVRRAEEHGFTVRVGNALIYRGQALALLGEMDVGIDEMKRGLTTWEEKGGIFHVSQWSAEAADTLLQVGRPDVARDLLDRAERVMNQTGEVAAEAEIARLRGEFALRSNDLESAERLYLRALDCARNQGAMMYAIRAALAVARLYVETGREGQAVATLRPVYDFFTEGFDVPVLAEAKALLDQIGG